MQLRVIGYLGLSFLILAGGACSKFVPLPMEYESPQPLKGELVLAAYNGNLGDVKELLARGSDIDENIGDEGKALTPLIAAIASNSQDVATYLVDRGAALSPSFEGYPTREMIYLSDLPKLLDSLKRNTQ